MGGQQFANGGTLVDMSPLDAVLGIDQEQGLVKAEAGIQWPALMAESARLQEGVANPWGIRQKQTGADTFSLGGSVAANIHGRGLSMRPFMDDVEELEVVQPDGQLLIVNRSINPELFRLVVGGYGLFGAVTAVTLRLARRRLMERVVEVRRSNELQELLASRIRDGYLYGDFQFSCDETSDDYLNRGVFSCYRPVGDDALTMPRARRDVRCD